MLSQIMFKEDFSKEVPSLKAEEAKAVVAS